MPAVTRISLPEDFYDITSALLLRQPEPQYLHGLLAKNALAFKLNGGHGYGLPGRGGPASGASVPNVDEHRLVLSDPIATEAVVAVNEGAVGHTIRLNRPKFSNTTYTEASREVSSGSTISTVPIDLQMEQVPLTLKRFSGPFDQTNNRVAPIAIDEFDAKRAVHDLVEYRGMQLVRDFDRWLDAVMVLAFDSVASANVVYPTGMSTDNGATTVDAFPLDVTTLFKAEELLAGSHIPRFSDGTYACVLTSRQIRELKDDDQFARYAQFQGPGLNPLLPNFIGKVGKLMIYESNTLQQVLNSSSVAIHYGQMFGPGKVGLAVSEMPRILMSTDDNYGLQSKVIWEMEGGFANLDNRFGCSIRTS